MKKILSAVLALSMLLFAFGALADTLAPSHSMDMTDYGIEDTCVTVFFEPETDISDSEISYDVYLDDIYPVEAVAALKAGDTVVSFGEEVTVATLEDIGSGYEINGGFMDGDNGLTFYYADGDPDSLYSFAYDDVVSRSNMGRYTLRLADQVTIHYYQTDEDGAPTGEMAETTLPAADVRGFFMDRSDSEAPDYLSVYGLVTLRSANSEVLEIFVEWTPSC